jgi:hypothetical protein
MTGSNMGSNQFRTDMPRYIDMYLDGRLHLDEMVSERISLDEVNDGFEEMKTGTVARSVITFFAVMIRHVDRSPGKLPDPPTMAAPDQLSGRGRAVVVAVADKFDTVRQSGDEVLHVVRFMS